MCAARIPPSRPVDPTGASLPSVDVTPTGVAVDATAPVAEVTPQPSPAQRTESAATRQFKRRISPENKGRADPQVKGLTFGQTPSSRERDRYLAVLKKAEEEKKK